MIKTGAKIKVTYRHSPQGEISETHYEDALRRLDKVAFRRAFDNITILSKTYVNSYIVYDIIVKADIRDDDIDDFVKLTYKMGSVNFYREKMSYWKMPEFDAMHYIRPDLFLELLPRPDREKLGIREEPTEKTLIFPPLVPTPIPKVEAPEPKWGLPGEAGIPSGFQQFWSWLKELIMKIWNWLKEQWKKARWFFIIIILLLVGVLTLSALGRSK